MPTKVNSSAQKAPMLPFSRLDPGGHGARSCEYHADAEQEQADKGIEPHIEAHGLAGTDANEGGEPQRQDHHRHQHRLGVAVGLEQHRVAQRRHVAVARALYQQANGSAKNKRRQAFRYGAIDQISKVLLYIQVPTQVPARMPLTAR